MGEWALTEDQVRWMVRNQISIRLAYELDDMDELDRLENSPEYSEAFGEMTWDEAFDRFECWLDGETSLVGK